MSVLVWFRDKLFGKKVEQVPPVVTAPIEPQITDAVTTQVTESKSKRKPVAKKTSKKTTTVRKK